MTRTLLLITLLLIPCLTNVTPAQDRPNIVLVMADDMGWGQTGYYNHPILKTPNLDAMAANGLRFDRFYAGAPNCSPTRATVMTGRTNDRTGVQNHGFPLRPQEKTIAQALSEAGYVTGHFGKWHLNGIRGPGIPIMADDIRGPGAFGFQTWLSVTNFFDRNPIMSRQGTFEEFEGDSSEICVDEAVKWIHQQATADKPFFTVIWYGTPHAPFVASEEDKAPFTHLDKFSEHQHGELVAMDRSIGTLRKGLRDAGVAANTLFWFCSDNGGLPKIQPSTVGNLRGFKGSVYEGGLRVPAIIEWPNGVARPRITMHPTATMDIFPTIVDVVGLPESLLIQPQDGVSIKPLLSSESGPRKKPIGFRHTNRGAIVDNNIKLVCSNVKRGEFELYDLSTDPAEQTDLTASKPKLAKRMQTIFNKFNASIEASVAGNDYPEKKVVPAEPAPIFWTELKQYEPYFEAWEKRPEYKSRLK